MHTHHMNILILYTIIPFNPLPTRRRKKKKKKKKMEEKKKKKVGKKERKKERKKESKQTITNSNISRTCPGGLVIRPVGRVSFGLIVIPNCLMYSTP